MTDQMKRTVLCYAIIFTMILLAFVYVIVTIIKIQTVEREKWEKVASNQVKTNAVIKGKRGNILDCKGRLLSGSLPYYRVRMDTRVEALRKDKGKLFYQYVDSIAIGMSQIVGDKSREEYKQRMIRAYKSKRTKGQVITSMTTHDIDYLQKKAIMQLPLVRNGVYKSGISFEDKHHRTKPYGSLASRTIGSIYGEGGYGNSGLEKGFEDYLKAKDGKATKRKVAGHWDYVPEIEAEDGCDIITTLDADLLDICETALKQRLLRTQAEWGCVVLMETKTGEVKAICNLDKNTDGTYSEKFNHAVIHVEPGSTFKTLSLMAVLDDGKKKLSDTIHVTRKPWSYYDADIEDAHKNDTFYDLKSALAVSSNIAFAKMVTSSYEKKAKKFVNKLQKMGMTDSVYCEIPGFSNPKILVPGDRVTLAKMAYGYSVELSPIQIAMFYNAIANNGKMVRPMLVKRIERDGKPIEEFDTEVIQSEICKKSTLKDVKSALHDVVWDNHLGTASIYRYGKGVIYKAQSERVHIAGKTGTAQICVNGRYSNQKHRITFVGYFPEENPEYTCLCMMNQPVGGYDAGLDCGTVVRLIAEQTMAYAGMKIWEDGQFIWQKQ